MADWVAQHRGARHHAWAYRIRTNQGLESRSNDAGEPSHSAGTPILHALQSAELQNVAAVVTRYFGGVKLGVGGLVTAYRSAAEDALGRALRTVHHPEALAQLTLPYELLGRMESDHEEPSIRWVAAEYTNMVTLTVAVWANTAAHWEGRWTNYYPLKWVWLNAP